jgi:hypothetical protein
MTATQISKLVRPLAPTKAAAACLIAATLAAGAAPAAAQVSRGEAISIATLERQFWACDHAATVGRIDSGTAISCGALTETFKQRKFNGDFNAMLAWWREHKEAEHLALAAAGHNTLARLAPEAQR